MHEDAHQHRVLDHIGEIAGVKGVPIIHLGCPETLAF
jgi:hypothetical protein